MTNHGMVHYLNEIPAEGHIKPVDTKMVYPSWQ